MAAAVPARARWAAKGSSPRSCPIPPSWRSRGTSRSGDPDKSKWESFCGKYEHPEDADFIVDEVWMQDGELYARTIDEDGDEMRFRLYPLGENEFGRKGGMLRLTFGEGCVKYDNYSCKKL